MSEFEKNEFLWEPETGMENKQQPEQTELPAEVWEEEVTDVEFEIPDIPSVVITPNEEPPKIPAKQQLKEMKKQYRQEKKRMRSCGRGRLFLTGLLSALFGGVIGAAVMYFLLIG